MGKSRRHRRRAAKNHHQSPASPTSERPAHRVQWLSDWLTPRRAWLFAAALFTLFLVPSIGSMRDDSPTVDEFVYPAEGQYMVLTGDFSFNPQGPPLVKLLGAIPLFLHNARLDLDPRWHTNAGGWEPWMLATKFMMDNVQQYHSLFVEARLFTVAFGLLMGLVVFMWAKELWGQAGGLLALALYVSCPNIVAHARLLTPDLPVALFMFLSSYFLWRLMKQPRWGHVAALGLSIGLAFASKFSAILLFVILPIQAAAMHAEFGNRLGALAGGRQWKGILSAAAVVAIITIVTIDAAYAFHGLFARLDAHGFRSEVFRSLSGALPGLRLPLPEGFLTGLDQKTFDASHPDFPGFMFGEWSSTGFRSYYLVSFLTKTPLAALALFCVALAPRGAKSAERDWPGVVVLITPVLTFLLLSTLIYYRVNIGLRYLLPLFPFMHVVSGRVVTLFPPRRAAPAVLGGLLIFQGYASASIYPHYLAYFNELVGGPKEAYKYFVDSNLDWGQDLKRLKAWMVRSGTPRVHLAYFGHVSPVVYGIDYEPLTRAARPAGTIAISASLLQGLAYPITYEQPGKFRAIRRDDFRWLRERQPLTTIGHSILIFQNEG